MSCENRVFFIKINNIINIIIVIIGTLLVDFIVMIPLMEQLTFLYQMYL